MSTPELALRDQVIALLHAAAPVTGRVGRKIRDDVPSDDEPDDLPWIYLGSLSVQRVELGCNPAWALRLRVFVESAAFDRDEARSIARAAIDALDGTEPSAVGFCDRLVVIQAGDVIEPRAIKSVFFDVTAMLVSAATRA